jgi:hypothetical protein
MTLGGLVIPMVLAGVMGAESPAGTAVVVESPQRRWMVTLDPSVYVSTGHLEESGPGASVPPPAYLGVTLERTFTGPLDVNVSAGAALSLGWMLGATVRYAGPSPSKMMRVSVGAGPAFVTSAMFGSGAFAQADAAIEVRFPRGAALVFGPRFAYALTNAGTPGCGVDTCNASMRRGDLIITLRSGVGFTF